MHYNHFQLFPFATPSPPSRRKLLLPPPRCCMRNGAAAGQLRCGAVTDADLEEAGLAADAIPAIAEWSAAAANV